jgi:bleomycin hydrolase
VDIDAAGSPRKWMVENSWGADYGFKGHIIMSDKWFSEYVFRLVVEKKYISEKLQQIAKEKPTLLPAWDPLFSPEP